MANLFGRSALGAFARSALGARGAGGPETFERDLYLPFQIILTGSITAWFDRNVAPVGLTELTTYPMSSGLFTNQGMQRMISLAYPGVPASVLTPIAAWIDPAGFTEVHIDDTGASHTGWSELVGFRRQLSDRADVLSPAPAMRTYSRGNGNLTGNTWIAGTKTADQTPPRGLVLLDGTNPSGIVLGGLLLDSPPIDKDETDGISPAHGSLRFEYNVSVKIVTDPA